MKHQNSFQSSLLADPPAATLAGWDRAICEHEAMLEALESRDGKKLSAILRNHLLEKRNVLLASEPAETTTPQP